MKARPLSAAGGHSGGAFLGAEPQRAGMRRFLNPQLQGSSPENSNYVRGGFVHAYIILLSRSERKGQEDGGGLCAVTTTCCEQRINSRHCDRRKGRQDQEVLLIDFKGKVPYRKEGKEGRGGEVALQLSVLPAPSLFFLLLLLLNTYRHLPDTFNFRPFIITSYCIGFMLIHFNLPTPTHPADTSSVKASYS
jgi:hypothetical protein